MYDFDLNHMEEQLQMQQARNMLMNWYKYEHSLNTADENLLLIIKSFFYRLSYLTNDERDFLAYIYYHEQPKDRPSNNQIANHFNLGGTMNVTKHKNMIISKLLAPVKAPYQPNKDNQTNSYNDDERAFKSAIIEQLFNELQKMHPNMDNA